MSISALFTTYKHHDAGVGDYIMALLAPDDTSLWYFCLEGSVNEDIKLQETPIHLLDVYFSTQSVALLYNRDMLMHRPGGFKEGGPFFHN